jgi:hypothetical protein
MVVIRAGQMDAQQIQQAKAKLATLVAAQVAEDVWTTPAMNARE